MSYFDLPTKEVQLDSENSFVIRKITYGERQDILDKTMKVRGALTDGDGSVDMNLAELKILTLVSCLVSWSGPGFDNKPVNRKNIESLPNWLVTRMSEEIDKFNAGLNEDEKND